MHRLASYSIYSTCTCTRPMHPGMPHEFSYFEYFHEFTSTSCYCIMNYELHNSAVVY